MSGQGASTGLDLVCHTCRQNQYVASLQPLSAHQRAQPQLRRSATNTKFNQERDCRCRKQLGNKLKALHTLWKKTELFLVALCMRIRWAYDLQKSSGFYSWALYLVNSDLSLQLTSFPILPCPRFHFPSYLNLSFYSFKLGKLGEP